MRVPVPLMHGPGHLHASGQVGVGALPHQHPPTLSCPALSRRDQTIAVAIGTHSESERGTGQASQELIIEWTTQPGDHERA
jgi:hypothetical protein